MEVRFAPFAARMRAEGLPDVAIATFRYYYERLVAGETGLIPESDIEPVTQLPDSESFDAARRAAGEAALSRTVLLKLNGGLGTSMGLQKAKALLPVKDGLTFLDVIARQALQSGIPLVLMNSFSTRADSLAMLANYPALQQSIPLDFLQHKVPKIRRADLAPATHPTQPELTWNPPGHGDIYTALVTSGMLRQLLEQGYQYAFVSNADNLGAVVDTHILGYFAAEQLPFMMEVADRTPADRKGGHLARRADGQLLLRESAQCPDEDVAAFQDIDRHRYFNTNNLWLNLPALQALLAARDNILGLPMIRNAKTVDPRDPASEPVYQLETAMGSAIATFPGAGAVRVPRSRFSPVKRTNDLLAVRSDAYVLSQDGRVMLSPERDGRTVMVTLDDRYYKLIDDLDARFPHGAPSLINCTRLQVAGDVTFGRDVIVRGDVTIRQEGSAPRHIPDGTVLSGDR